jgi:VWFA-related protein
MRQFLFICLLIFPCFVVQAQQPGAPEILQRVAGVYAGCRSYSDEGNVGIKAGGFGGSQTHFRTAFVSPERFRFELTIGGNFPAWVVWKDGDEVRTSGALGVPEYKRSDLDTVLLRMAIFSSGASLTMPELLLPQSLRTSDLFSLITDPTLTGEEKIDGHPAYRIEGRLWDQPIKIWIDRTQYLILKVYRKTSFGGIREQETTVQYKPKLNADIPPEMLVAPPATIVDTYRVFPAAPTAPAGSPPKLKSFGASLAPGLKDRLKAAASRSDDDDVVRVDTDLVMSFVLVVDKQGKIVNGLAKDDFVVTEDDKVQEIASLSLGNSKDVPRSIVLIIDYSGSQLPYIRTSVESAKMLVDKLNPRDRMAIVTDDVKLLVDFTSDKALLKSQLETLKTSALGGTIGASNQYDAILAALNELFSSEDIRPIVIFQTDGDQLEALKGSIPQTPFWLPRKFSLQDILTVAEKKKATIYPVISGVRFAGIPDPELPERARIDWQNRLDANAEYLRAHSQALPKEGPPQKDALVRYTAQWQQRQNALVSMAKATGTWPEFLEKPSQADEIYTRILTDIDRRYIIGYYPTNRTRDGKRRRVNVEVRGHPEYLVWGQKSYFAHEN